ncbi:outer membrane beta-barrel protein [Polaribacter reichenbachii]|uniref:outer membrane beta-barrel protein n=1 Tax=Polaribacter reichenbachii TaxID=996801 RepID=UPI0009F2C36F|nr:outer membrane beta-barrel protein [Polaribacter reichenbachii]
MKYKKRFLNNCINKCLLLIGFIGFSISIQAQNSGIKGIVTDNQKIPLEMVSVAILSPKDSTFLSYATTDLKGIFHLQDVPKDTVIIQLNLLGFTQYSKKLVYNNSLIDLKTIVLEDDVSSLDEIVIAAVVPIQIKKDTVSYNANSFKVNHDDNIEGLLGKLPGMEIEDGKIISQGNAVTKIMIDGKEFFGGDPSIVLKNISADAIAKVEVIDKKSDEAELTGVSDGNKQIVINFTLKKTKKNRGFGKVSGGLGLDNRYFGNANYNQFNSKTQLSVIGKFNNINITGSNIQGFLENADGVADESEDDTNDNFNIKQKSLSGFLETKVTGVHYGRELKKRESLNADYFYNASENSGISETNRINFTNTNNFNFKSTNDYLNTTNNHNFNFNYENKANKTHTIKLRGRFYTDDRNYNLDRKGVYENENNEIVTENNLLSNNTTFKKYGNINFNLYRRLLKKGRSFNTGFNWVVNNYDRENDQHTFITRNINTDTPVYQEIIALRDEESSSSNFNLRFKYTEPLGGNHYLNAEVNASFYDVDESTDQSRTTIKTTIEEDFIKFDYTFFQNIMRTKLFHSYNTPKINISTTMELYNLRREFGQEIDQIYTKEKLYVTPSFFFQYKPNRGEKLRFTYRRVIRAPRPRETNPFINDLSPYFIRTGNVDLQPEKVHSFVSFYNVNSSNSSINFNTRLQYNYSTDAIIRSYTIDDDYIRTSSYQNNGERHRLNAQVRFSKKLNKLGVRFNLNNRFFYNSANSIVNFNLNKIESQDISTNFVIQNTRKRKVDLKAGVFYGVNNTSFSIEKDLDRKFTTQKYFGMVDVDATKRLNLNTQLDYIIYNDDKFDIHQELPIWNAAMSYSLSPKNNIVKLVLIDLLNKNVDVFRRSTDNFFEETIGQSLGRYVILSYTYRLNNGKRKPKRKSS